MNHSAAIVKAIVRVLKQKYSNLTAEESIDLAYKILDAIEDAKSSG